MNEVERKFKEKATVSKKFTIPMITWEEWEEDCRLQFNNTYHLKMHFDHEFRKQFQNVSNLLIGDVAELQQQVFDLKAQIEEINLKMSQHTQGDEKSSPSSSKGAKTKTFG